MLTSLASNFESRLHCLTFQVEPIENRSRDGERASYILAFMMTYIAVLYFQAGLSKLLLGGWQWFLEGERIRAETLILGTPFGKWLLQWPFVFRLLGLGTGIFELVLPFLFFFQKTRCWAACCAIAFHLGTFAVMGISFWFLWTLYPAIFLYEKFKRRQFVLP